MLETGHNGSAVSRNGHLPISLQKCQTALGWSRVGTQGHLRGIRQNVVGQLLRVPRGPSWDGAQMGRDLHYTSEKRQMF